MTSLFSYLLTFIAVMFWIFRGTVAVLESLNIPFICTTLNLQIEIIIIFATLICILLVIKRNIIGAALYMGIYVTYFGTAIYDWFKGNSMNNLNISNSISFLSAIIGIVIPTLTFLDILINKNRKNVGLDQKTEWYYKNGKFEREYDERADRNQYKF